MFSFILRCPVHLLHLPAEFITKKLQSTAPNVGAVRNLLACRNYKLQVYKLILPVW